MWESIEGLFTSCLQSKELKQIKKFKNKLYPDSSSALRQESGTLRFRVHSVS